MYTVAFADSLPIKVVAAAVDTAVAATVESTGKNTNVTYLIQEPEQGQGKEKEKDRKLKSQSQLHPKQDSPLSSSVLEFLGTIDGSLNASDEIQALRLAYRAPLQILNSEVEAGERKQLQWAAGESFFGQPLTSPVLVVHGRKEGKTLCLTSAIHGDELNGVEVIIRTLADINPEQLSGTIIGVPIVNVLGFTRQSRYLPDRRDLNRYFPGNDYGSTATRVAYSLFSQVISYCDMLVDFHTGSLMRTNMPHIRADLRDRKVKNFAQHFTPTSVLHKVTSNTSKTLRAASVKAGISAVTYELGEPMLLQPEYVQEGLDTIHRLLLSLNMLPAEDEDKNIIPPTQVTYLKSRWTRVNSSGILTSTVALGDNVEKNSRLGIIVNPITNESHNVLSSSTGTIIGMALNQFVLQGYAAFHIGITSTKNNDNQQDPFEVDESIMLDETDDTNPDSEPESYR